MDLEKIKKRLNKASKGPWFVSKKGSKILVGELSTPEKKYYTQAEDYCIVDKNKEEILGTSEWLRVSKQDLVFMANARQDIEDLILEVERLASLITNQ